MFCSDLQHQATERVICQAGYSVLHKATARLSSTDEKISCDLRTSFILHPLYFIHILIFPSAWWRVRLSNIFYIDEHYQALYVAALIVL